MASLCSGVRSLPSTPPCCPQSRATGRLDVSAQQSAEQFWSKQGGGRSGLTPSWRSSTVAPCEVGGRWSEESRQFLASFAAAKTRSEPELMRMSTMFCWLRRWCTLMVCTAANAFSLSLFGAQVLRGRRWFLASDNRGGGGPLPNVE